MGLSRYVSSIFKRQAWNNNETYLLLITGDGRTFIFDGNSYQLIKELPQVGGDDIFWDPNNPNKLIFPLDNTLYSYNIATDKLEIIKTFSSYALINTRGEGNLSNDGRYYAFLGQIDNPYNPYKDIVVYDLQQNSVIATLALPTNLENFDWVSISPKGNYVVVDYATENTGRFQGVEVYTRNMQFLWQKPLGYGHSDLAIDENGDEVLIMDSYDPIKNCNSIKKFKLSDGTETSLLDYSWQFDSHISTRHFNNDGWILISTFDGPARLTDDSLSWLPFEDEIFFLKMNGSQLVKRIAHHRSKRFSPITPDPDNSCYWAEPHATISPSGTRILSGSNWRMNVHLDESVDAYIIDLRNLLSAEKTNDFLQLNLYQNYPNPFNSSSIIKFYLPEQTRVTLNIFDSIGRKIASLIDQILDKGSYEIPFSSELLNTGVYFFQLKAGNNTLTKKMIHLK